MNTKFQSLLFIFVLLFLFSCKKESVSVSQTSPGEYSDDGAMFVEKTTSGTKITLRPNLKNGQDTYVAKIDDDPNDGNTNLDNTHELCMARWVAFTGGAATWRSFIRFDDLALIPKTSTIISAKLYLYGVSSSISFPSGNSYYVGSANPKNPCFIQRVIGSSWDEHTLTWNTQPFTTTTGQALIPASRTQWNYDVDVDVIDIVKEMVAHPNKNYGFCIKLKDETVMYQSMIFGTSEVSDKSKRPKLVVEYE